MAQRKGRHAAPGMAWATVATWLAVGSTVVFLPNAQSRWVWPKLVVLALAIAIGALVTPRGRLPRWFVVTLLAGGAVVVAATLLSAAPWAQAWGRWPRYEGLIALPLYAGTIWLGARVLGTRNRASSIAVLQRAAIVVAILLGGFAVVEAIGLRPISSDISRPGSLTGTATDQGILGAILVAVLFLGVVKGVRMRARDRASVLLYVGFISALAAVVTSASRAGLLALGAALTVAVVAEAVASHRRGLLGAEAAVSRRKAPSTPASEPTLSPRFVIGAGAMTAVMVAATAIAIPFTRARLLGGLSSDAPWSSDRPLIWRESLGLIGDRPWFGWGPSGFEDAVAHVHGPEWYSTMGQGVVLDSPHSGYFQLALAGGIPLLLLALGALVVVGRVVIQRWSVATVSAEPVARADADLYVMAAAAVTALGVGLVTSFTSVTIVAIPALLLGAAVATRVDVRGTESRRSRRRRRGLAAALVSWTVFLAVAASAEVPLVQAEQAAAGGDVASALSFLEQADARRPWDVDLDIIGAEILAAAADRGTPGAAEAAIARADEALRRVPGNYQAAMALAVAETVLGAVGDSTALSAAHRTLSDLASEFPNDPVVAHRFAGVLIYEGRLSEAEAQLVHATSIDPNNRNILLTLEYVYETLGDDVALAAVRNRIEDLSGE